MRNVIAASVVVLLLAGTSLAGVGDVFQLSEFGLGLNSTVAFNTGQGEAETHQNLNLLNNQTAGNVGLGTWATQSAIGALGQKGEVEGNNPAGSVVQSLGVDGTAATGFGQTQNIAAGGTVAQSQGVAVLGKQDLLKAASGDGEVEGTNNFMLGMSEAGGTICSNMSSCSLLGGQQKSEIEGGPCSSGLVSTQMTAATSQVQQVN